MRSIRGWAGDGAGPHWLAVVSGTVLGEAFAHAIVETRTGFLVVAGLLVGVAGNLTRLEFL